jgi:hypothetical protein
LYGNNKNKTAINLIWRSGGEVTVSAGFRTKALSFFKVVYMDGKVDIC